MTEEENDITRMCILMYWYKIKKATLEWHTSQELSLTKDRIQHDNWQNKTTDIEVKKTNMDVVLFC